MGTDKEKAGGARRLWHSPEERPGGGRDVVVLRDNMARPVERWEGRRATASAFRAFGVVRWCYFDELAAIDMEGGGR